MQKGETVAKWRILQQLPFIFCPASSRSQRKLYPYTTILKGRFAQMLSDQSQPIHALLDTKKAKAFMAMPSDYAKPWYGQLMAGPQLYAYLLQVNDWLNAYKIRIKL